MKRISYIDIARAFAIIFIVFGHTIVHSVHMKQNVYTLLYSFHVPLFFLISGYVFKVKNNFIEFFKNKFIRIMIPYFVWAVLFLIPYMILGENVSSNLEVNAGFNIKQQFVKIIYGNGNLSALRQNSSLWFLPALFSMQIIFYLIIKYLDKNKNSKYILMFTMLILGYLCSKYLKFIFPWGINTTICLGIFFYIGYILKRDNFLERVKYFNNIYFFIVTVIIGSFSCFLNYRNVNCMDYEYGNYFLAILSGISFSMAILYISRKIDNNKIMEYIGRNTMGIVIFHKLIVLVFQTKLGKISSLLINSNFIVELAISLLITVISIFISLIINYIVDKICPVLIGNRKNKKVYNNVTVNV